ncbi:MAG TPA: hypothetical protein VI279_08425 [Rhodocyclaceae bacterium]
MKMLSSTKILLFLAALALLSGCTEEKAKALQAAAVSFKNEADLACDMASKSITASVAMPPRTRDEIAKSLERTKKFESPELQAIYSDAAISVGGMKSAQDALSKACNAHRKLAAMYDDLPRAYLLSTDDVKKAQRLVVNVTARFAKLAYAFNQDPDNGKDNVARSKILKARQNAMVIKDPKQREPILEGIADDILANQKNEEQNRTNLLAQFAKAVELGEKLAHASTNYDKMTLADLLELLKEFSSLYGNVTGRVEVAKNALDRITKAEDRIKKDQVLSPLLEEELTQ